MKTSFVMALLVLAACGGSAPSATSVCKNGCEKTIDCSGGTTADIASCKDACTSTDNTLASSLASCTNSDAILSCVNGCYGVSDCNDSGKCVTGCPKCVTNSSVDGSTAPLSDGGTLHTDGGTLLADASTSGGSCQLFCDRYEQCNPDMSIGTACEQVCSFDGGTCPGGFNLGCYESCAAAGGTCEAFMACGSACPKCN